MDESRKMNSNAHQIWSLAKDTAKKVESLYTDVAKVSLSWLMSVLIIVIYVYVLFQIEISDLI